MTSPLLISLLPPDEASCEQAVVAVPDSDDDGPSTGEGQL